MRPSTPRKPKNITLYLAPRIQAALEDRTPPGSGRSEALTGLLATWEELVRRNSPRSFREQEWLVVFDALAGMAFDASGIIPDLQAVIEDRMEMEGLDAKWGAFPETIRASLQDLTFQQSIALLDATIRFWSEYERQSATGGRPDPLEITQRVMQRSLALGKQ